MEVVNINDTTLFIFVTLFFVFVPIIISSIGETFTEVDTITTSSIAPTDYPYFEGEYCAFEEDKNWFSENEFNLVCVSNPDDFSTQCSDYLDYEYVGDCSEQVFLYNQQEGMIDKFSSFFSKFGSGISILPTTVNIGIFSVYSIMVIWLITKV